VKGCLGLGRTITPTATADIFAIPTADIRFRSRSAAKGILVWHAFSGECNQMYREEGSSNIVGEGCFFARYSTAPRPPQRGYCPDEARNPTSALCFVLRPIKPFEARPAWVTRRSGEYDDQFASR